MDAVSVEDTMFSTLPIPIHNTAQNEMDAYGYESGLIIIIVLL